MKVGDLVKIYDNTEKARKQMKQQGGFDDIDAHRYGLIIDGCLGSDLPKPGHYREVLRSCDGESEFYNIVRLEAVSESR